MSRKLSAHYIFPANKPPLKRGIVVVENDGTIIDVIDTKGKLHESESLEFFDGIITPGFVLGIDNPSHNSLLSILEEMKTFQENFKDISLDALIAWGTINAAKALGVDNKLGSISIGKKPGLYLITNIDFDKMQLTSQSEVKEIL